MKLLYYYTKLPVNQAAILFSLFKLSYPSILKIKGGEKDVRRGWVNNFQYISLFLSLSLKFKGLL